MRGVANILFSDELIRASRTHSTKGKRGDPMKKTLSLIVLLSVVCFGCPTVEAAGLYDGIWLDELGSYSSVYQKGNTIVYVSFDKSGNWSQVFVGKLSGHVLMATNRDPAFTMEVQVTFNTLKTATSITLSCTGSCSGPIIVPIGTPISSRKIF